MLSLYILATLHIPKDDHPMKATTHDGHPNTATIYECHLVCNAVLTRRCLIGWLICACACAFTTSPLYIHQLTRTKRMEKHWWPNLPENANATCLKQWPTHKSTMLNVTLHAHHGQRGNKSFRDQIRRRLYWRAACNGWAIQHHNVCPEAKSIRDLYTTGLYVSGDFLHSD